MKVFNLIDLMAMRDHFSPSFLSDMFSCSMKAVLKGVLKLDGNKRKSPAMLKGSIIHKALECYFLKLKSNGQYGDTAKNLTQSFDEAIGYYTKNAQYYDKDVLASAFKYFKGNTELIKALALFLDKKYKHISNIPDDKIHTELAFEKIRMCGFNFTGRIDLMYNSEVIDFKTSSQGHDERDQDKYARKIKKLTAEFCQQLLIYKRALEHISETGAVKDILTPEKFTIIEIILTKAPKINEYTFTQEEVEKAATELTERVETAIGMLNNKTISRNYRDTGCPCELCDYCMDDSNLKMVLSKLNIPTDFF